MAGLSVEGRPTSRDFNAALDPERQVSPGRYPICSTTRRTSTRSFFSASFAVGDDLRAGSTGSSASGRHMSVMTEKPRTAQPGVDARRSPPAPWTCRPRRRRCRAGSGTRPASPGSARAPRRTRPGGRRSSPPGRCAAPGRAARGRRAGTCRGSASPRRSSFGPMSGLSPSRLMWSSMTMRSPLAYCGFMPPQALLTIEHLAAQRLHHAHRERDLLERVALVEVEAALHGHDGLARRACRRRAGRRATGRWSAGSAGCRRRGWSASACDLLGQPAQAGAEDDADARRAWPPGAGWLRRLPGSGRTARACASSVRGVRLSSGSGVRTRDLRGIELYRPEACPATLTPAPEDTEPWPSTSRRSTTTPRPSTRRPSTPEDKLACPQEDVGRSCPSTRPARRCRPISRPRSASPTTRSSTAKTGPKKAAASYKIPRQGAGQVVLLGAPNAGKSRLLSRS